MKMLRLLSIGILALPLATTAQQDSTYGRLNTIKVHLVSSFLYSNSAAFSYERITKPNQSWAAMVGYVQFPRLGNLGSSIKTTDESNTGYVVGAEYRFYLKKENKYAAPHGIYVGPYVNYFGFNNKSTLSFTSSTGTVSEAVLNSKIDVLNIGVELGYQFVIKDRWTIDVIFLGPSLSSYKANMHLTGNFDVSEEDILESEILSALVDRFPMLKDLLGKEPVNVQGTSSKWAGGFRYQLNVGYRFGRGKKH